MDTDQTFRLSALTYVLRISLAGHRRVAGQLCPHGASSTEKRENDSQRQLKTRARRPENDLNPAHHSFVGRLRLFWD